MGKQPNSDFPKRGSLQIAVTPSTPTISAGSSFSIAVTITNPFDVPIVIGKVTSALPFDLFDVSLAAELAEKRKAKRKLEATKRSLLQQFDVPTHEADGGDLKRTISSAAMAAWSLMPGLGALNDVAGAMADITSTAVARAIGAGVGSLSAEIALSPKVRLEGLDRKALSREQAEAKVAELLLPLEEEYTRQFDAAENEKVMLQPGNSIAKVFNLRTKRGITFRPTSYSLSILVVYKADGREHRQAVPYSLDIQAAIQAVIAGALIGAAFGALASTHNILDVGQWQVMIPRLVPALILSAFAAIAFSRKEGVQPIIAVQDFWGGLLIGFLVGYSGTQVLGNLFGNSALPKLTVP